MFLLQFYPVKSIYRGKKMCHNIYTNKRKGQAKMDVNQIITRIGIIRTKANLSARALSLMIGKNSTYITKMEAGEFTPNLSTLFEIISACNCTAEEFFATNFATFRQDQQLCTLICNMPDKRKQTLLNFLQTI